MALLLMVVARRTFWAASRAMEESPRAATRERAPEGCEPPVWLVPGRRMTLPPLAKESSVEPPLMETVPPAPEAVVSLRMMTGDGLRGAATREMPPAEEVAARDGEAAAQDADAAREDGDAPRRCPSGS